MAPYLEIAHSLRLYGLLDMFYNFFSIGYGFGVSALAVTIALLFKDVLTVPTAMLCAVMFIFGCRLGLYLLTREKRSPEYKKILYGPDAARTTLENLSYGQEHLSLVSGDASQYGSG